MSMGDWGRSAVSLPRAGSTLAGDLKRTSNFFRKARRFRASKGPMCTGAIMKGEGSTIKSE